MKRLPLYFLFALTIHLNSCKNSEPALEPDKTIRLITLDPGHFHAALVQKQMYDGVDSTVHVYASSGPDVQLHLDRINAFNTREQLPTRWKEEIHTSDNFLEKMLEEKSGNVVVISGNNIKKTEYITKSLDAGLNVLADKPMAISGNDFLELQEAFNKSQAQGLLLYDIMTERFEITTLLQREFSMIPEIFGTLQKGTPEEPAVTKESVHHFFKYVSGNVLARPAWFMDVSQQGEGIVDVTTHLVDLVQWECFPEQVIDYKKDIQLINARRWPTAMTLHEFKAITKLDHFPDYLKKDLSNDTTLAIYSNGEISYTLKDVHAKVSVTWAYRAKDGTGDTHFSVMRGTKANLVIRQGAEQEYKPALYIEPTVSDPSYESVVLDKIKSIQLKYPGIALKKISTGWEVVIPEEFKEGHEAHFAKVMQNFLAYLKDKTMPGWEVPNMIAKYYTTTQALELAKQKK
jgi:predicted dehydrogenase